jgi:hypothetical protein
MHISVVWDRSGSMASIADDIVGGFNEFLGRQRGEDGEARMTLAQFDDQDPFEVLIDGVPVREVTVLPREAYQPRGTTPLLFAGCGCHRGGRGTRGASGVGARRQRQRR